MTGSTTHVILGGGAAGLFAALACAKRAPDARVILLEKTRQLLAKVRISGGGRCNVTHAAFDPKLLVQNYPRGGKELLGPFHSFQPRDTVAWFAERGVPLKTEEDGRMFPVTDSSETIIACLLAEARACHVEIRTEQKVTALEKTATGFRVHHEDASVVECHSVLLATGSSSQGHTFAAKLGHTVIPPVPSLFTLNVPTSGLLDLSGITVADATLTLPACSLRQRGALLLTHWGFSGPAALKLSAWGARFLHAHHYQTELQVQWVSLLGLREVEDKLLTLKKTKPLKTLEQENPFALPMNLWKRLIQWAGLAELTPLGHVSKKGLQQVAELLLQSRFQIEGKTTYKQEFVTCGGISLKEVDFKTLESRLVPGLYFAGECLDIDGVTGGFNFQSAWTTGWIAGRAMANKGKV